MFNNRYIHSKYAFRAIQVSHPSADQLRRHYIVLILKITLLEMIYRSAVVKIILLVSEYAVRWDYLSHTDQSKVKISHERQGGMILIP